MELRAYWLILRRRWWIPILLIAVVGAISLVQIRPWQTPPPTYSASLRLLLGVLPLEEADRVDYDPRYYAWLTSEYLVDDFSEVVGSQLFAQGINRRLAEKGLSIPAGAISGSATTGKQHRIITLNLNWGDAEQLAMIAAAAAAELEENAADYFFQLGTEGALVRLLDSPTIVTVGPDLRSRLELPLRLLLAILAGIGLILFLDYWDDSIRSKRDLEEAGLLILGAIPRE